MDNFLDNLKGINTIEKAVELLNSTYPINDQIQKALDFSTEAHKEQFRKSGEPYIVHPILVAAITGFYSNDEAMIIAALLHDIVEDTYASIEEIETIFGKDIAHIVDGLTKIVEMREHELLPSDQHDQKLIKSALTFRKMLVASIDDVRVMVVKLCDRVHNMLTLDALPDHKQQRISEETLVVYAPIAHRLGISTIKNVLENLSFYYLFPQEWEKIDSYIKQFQQKMHLTLNNFLTETKKILAIAGYEEDQITIYSRIKHYYSIYLKMQRKGVSIDEVLDLYAIRILVKEPIDCYNVLGVIHIHYKPLIARFKDYISVPKENGYQTLHTTVFSNSKIFEVQIRTFDMHDVAEYGVAAHWKYKSGANASATPNLEWLHTLATSDANAVDLYDEAKHDLFSEDIVVYSPKGDIFTLPRGATAFDFAFEIHTDVGSHAIECFINKVKKPLLTELKIGDIVSIVTHTHIIPRCTWQDMVKTTKAKKAIKTICHNRLKHIDELASNNIINTIFSRYKQQILENVKGLKLGNILKVVYNLDHLKHTKKLIQKHIISNDGLFARLKVQNLKLKEYRFDNVLVYSNFSINSVSFDHCCHPKFGDSIVALKDGKDVVIHHKMCETAYKLMKKEQQMLHCDWINDKFYTYKMVVSIPNVRGELARLLTHLSVDHEATVLFIEYGKDKYASNQYCTIDFEMKNGNKERVRAMIEQKAKVIEFYLAQDAYK
ncbi:MAG: bifunctional (p)ppGpp synthetase/guanosine-3',5'-bis(diphosphate) 3'-pyrophosphohydrolase [Campylobacterales bacterium]|nr:bifunctional (p)ppGpp synthetase/guanosine-3',5'-bis(diphosphate) 3'-pyrophosphohydrolase [Campylobacterales bacterium]